MLLKSPLEVFWCLTDRCNLRCRFCLSESDLKAREKELDAEQRAFILDDLVRSRILKVYLTGGEPLLIPETLDYVKHLRDNGIFTVLTTNSLLLDQRVVQRLADYGLNRIQVSVHGSTPEINDPLMGGNALQGILQALAWIRDAGIELHLKTTITRQNIRDLPDLMEKLLPFGPSLINASEVTATGRGFTYYESLRPSLEALSWARERIGQMNQEGARISFRSHSLFFSEIGRPGTCTLGNTAASTCLILPDGNMTPCTPAYVWGLANNVVEEGIRGAWERLPLYARFVQSDKLQGRCGACEIVEECKGGCRAEAYRYTNNVWGEYSPCVRLSREREEQKV